MKKTFFSFRIESVKIENHGNLSMLEIDPSFVDPTEILKPKKLQPIKESLLYRIENNCLVVSGEAKPISDLDFVSIPG